MLWKSLRGGFPSSLEHAKITNGEISDRHRLRETSWQTIPTLSQPKTSELSFCYLSKKIGWKIREMMLKKRTATTGDTELQIQLKDETIK